jgi:hypothetical protein
MNTGVLILDCVESQVQTQLSLLRENERTVVAPARFKAARLQV